MASLFIKPKDRRTTNELNSSIFYLFFARKIRTLHRGANFRNRPKILARRNNLMIFKLQLSSDAAVDALVTLENRSKVSGNKQTANVLKNTQGKLYNSIVSLPLLFTE